MRALLLLVAVACAGRGGWLDIPRCDMAEINHCYDDGQLRFIQLLPANWHHDDHRLHYEGYRIIDQWAKTPYGVVGWRNDQEQRWHLQSAIVHETWTDFDPEREDQRVFPCNMRRDPWGASGQPALSLGSE